MEETDIDSRIKELLNTFTTSLTSSLTPNNDDVNLLNKLQGLVTNIKWSPTDVVDLFSALLKRFDSTTTNDRSHLHSWMMKMLHCIEINCITPSWKCHSGKTVIELIQDTTVTDDNLKHFLANDKEKTLDEILEEIRQQKLNQIDEKLLNDVRDIVSSVNRDLTLNNDGSQRSGLKKDLLLLCQAAEKTHFRPRLTQIVSLCLMALCKTGLLIQVGTGEGKSCIVAMFAAYRAMRGEAVDIITSSSVLAERDLNEWLTFYSTLKISVSCNTNKQVENLKKCYECEVVYGTAEQFAGHWLYQQFERMDIFGKRTFRCAIVDEVDSLMLDKGGDMVYISSDMPALQHLNPLLALIWDTAIQFSKIGNATTVGKKYPFLQVVLENINPAKDDDELAILQIAEDTGILAKGSVKDLRKNPNLLTEKTKNVTAKKLAEFFKTVQRKFPSCSFGLHCINNKREIEELNRRPQTDTDHRVPLLLINDGFCHYMYSDQDSVIRAAEAEVKHALCFTPCDPSEDKNMCCVPGFLSGLIDSKLKIWIDNAFKAQTMQKDHEYVIEKHGIVPVDYSSTGVVENFRVLSDGLQQFLEMKHKVKLSDMTAITNYKSNVGLFLNYDGQIYGMSGTLGQQAETDTLQKIYEGIKTCRIPSFKRRKLFEVEGVIINDETEWTKKICSVVVAETKPSAYRAGRAVLVICETINRAKDLHLALGDQFTKKMLYISNNMDNSEVFEELQTGDVIIATNLAGRGTDLKVSDDVKKAGGLFVLQTFLPKNARVEAQAFGRTARQGSPGSAQLIVCSSHLPEPLNLQVLVDKVLFSLENITNGIQVYQDLFVEQFWLNQNTHRHEESRSLTMTLFDIVTKTSDSKIMTAKKARDNNAAESLANFSVYAIPNIKKKEELFSQYIGTLDNLYESNDNKPAKSDLSALNEFWGMWLLKNFSEDDSITHFKSKLETDLCRAIQKLKQRESPSSNLHQYTAFGNELRENGNLGASIKMYTKAIQEDHNWAAIAYYNRAFASLTQQKRCPDRNCIDQALADLQNALKSVEFFHKQTEVTHTYSTEKIKNSHSHSTTRLDSQITVRHKVLKSFKENINKAIEMLEKARHTTLDVTVNKKEIMSLIPFLHSLSLVSLVRKSRALINSGDPLKIYQLISHPFFDITIELTRLQSLGLTHVYTLDIPFSIRSFFSSIFK